MIAEKQIGVWLNRRDWQLMVAESCTGGLLAARITAVLGSSTYFTGGVVAYANAIKTGLLAVPVDVMEQYGAVSEQVALWMARGVKRLGADVGVSVTGIAGPGGGTEFTSVGETYIGVCTPLQEQVRYFNWNGSRHENRVRSVEAALSLLLRILES